MKALLFLSLVAGCATSDDLQLARSRTRACLELREERLAMVSSGRVVAVPSCAEYQRQQSRIADQLDAQRRLGRGISDGTGAMADSISRNSR